MPAYRKLVLKTTESLTVNEMPDDFHRFLWLMLPLIVCREGRGLDNAAWVKAKALPLRMDITPDDVQKAMDWFADHEIITRYTVNGYNYFFITNWKKYQGNTDKEAESIYPDPNYEQLDTNSEPTQEPVKSNSASIQYNAIQYNTNHVRDFFDELAEAWKNYYPEKRQYKYETVKDKISARYKNKGFKEKWAEALRMSCNVNDLRSDGWFSFEYFIRNNTNYLKLLDGTFSFKNNHNGKSQPPPRVIKPVTADDI